MSSDRLLTTTEAGRLVGRGGPVVRKACSYGSLPGTKDTNGFWWVREDDLRAWHARAPHGQGRRPLPRARTDDVAALLADWGSGSSDEVARAVGVHVGNARKWLKILETEGRAQRLEDGQWVLTSSEVPLAC
jgi:hypothetical protein